MKIMTESSELGRLNVIDIANLMGVKRSEVIEPTVLDLCKEGKGKLVNGQYITPAFTATFIEEVRITLKNLGKIILSELAHKYTLPLDFVRDTIISAISDQKLTECQL